MPRNIAKVRSGTGFLGESVPLLEYLLPGGGESAGLLHDESHGHSLVQHPQLAARVGRWNVG